MASAGTDVEVLTRGFRARLWLLALLVIGALGAALWSGTREQGIGEAEDRRRVMVVTRGSDINYYAVLERGGFVIEVDSFADWESGARELLPDSEASGAALVLELADLRGFGFVVFEAPAQLDFGALELEPALAEIEELEARDYAVLSVGDLGFPHHLSVDAPGEDEVLRMPGYGALEALFEQPAITTREDPERPTVEELQYEDAIEVARWMHRRPATFRDSIEYAKAGVAAELAEVQDARSLVELFDTGSAIPTPEGGVLVIHHALEVISENAQTLELRPQPQMRIDYLGPEALTQLVEGGALALEPCTTLAGGSLELAEQPQLEAAIDGSALSISTGLDDAALWRKLEGPGCRWEVAARVPQDPSAGVLAPRLSAAGVEQRSLLAQVGIDEDGAAIASVWLAAQVGQELDSGKRSIEADPELADEAGSRPELVELLRLGQGGNLEFRGLAFIDDERLALVSREALPLEQRTSALKADYAVHIVDRRRPGTHLRVPNLFFAEDLALRELVVLAPAQPAGPSETPGAEPELRWARGPRLALTTTHTQGPTRLVTVEVGAAAWQSFEDAVLDPSSEPGLVTLTPEDLRVQELGEGQALAGLVAAPGGEALAYVAAEGAAANIMLAAVSEEGSEADAARVLTQSPQVDALPRFTADGRHVVFVTMMRTSLAPASFSVPRLVPTGLP